MAGTIPIKKQGNGPTLQLIVLFHYIVESIELLVEHFSKCSANISHVSKISYFQ